MFSEYSTADSMTSLVTSFICFYLFIFKQIYFVCQENMYLWLNVEGRSHRCYAE